MKRQIFAIALVLGTISPACWGQQAGGGNVIQHLQQEPRAVAKESSLQPVLAILDKSKASGSFEISGSCKIMGFPGFFEFPQVKTRAAIGGSPLQDLRKLFADDSAMKVTRDSDGTIRMVQRGVQADILNVKIHHIAFGQGAYYPNVALDYIVEAPEIQLFMKSHDIQWPFGGVLSGPAGEIPPTSPHISGSMDDVTLSDALDRVLKTFPSLWVYQNCPQTDEKSRTIYVNFYELPSNPKPVLTPIPRPSQSKHR